MGINSCNSYYFQGGYLAFEIVTVNYWAVLGAAVASFAVGMLWYGPLFGKKWMAMMGITEKSMKSMKDSCILTPAQSMSIGFVSTLVMAYVLKHVLVYAGAATLAEGLQGAFWVWLGFLTTKALGGVLWENKSWNLYFLNTAHDLVSIAAMATVLVYWV